MQFYKTRKEAMDANISGKVFLERLISTAGRLGFFEVVKIHKETLDYFRSSNSPIPLADSRGLFEVIENNQIVGYRMMTDDELTGFIVNEAVALFNFDSDALPRDVKEKWQAYTEHKKQVSSIEQSHTFPPKE